MRRSPCRFSSAVHPRNQRAHGAGSVPLDVPGDMFERDRVIRKRLFRDHIPHQNDEQLVGQLPGGLPESIELLRPVFGGQVGEEVGWLPGMLDRGEKRKVLLDEFL